MSCLEIKDLHVNVEEKEIVKGINIKIKKGEIHAIMGPNGAGKSTLSYAVMGHPKYKITKGQIILEGEDITSLPPDERARKGLFLAFQYPVSIPGLSLANFLKYAYNASKGKNITNKGEEIVSSLQFQKILKEKMKLLGIKESFVERSLNEGFSGGEKKKAEVLQLAVLEPKFAFLDETDSGLDIDALKTVASAINKLVSDKLGIVIITHYQRMLKYIKPDYVHIMVDGKIIRTGGARLADELEEKGYEGFA
jgi:Fe-S cluster assembly ATP-binding protein